MRRAPLSLLLVIAAGACGVEAKIDQGANPKPAEATSVAPAPAVAAPDPTAAIVAEGRYVYRQRDVDALLLIAARHARTRFTKADEERLRSALTTALIAREPLLDALAALPAGFTAAQREALVLDLLDYQAEPAKAPATPAASTAAAPSPGAPPSAAGEPGPLLIRLPPLVLTRSLPGVGKRSLSLTIALFFRDPTLAQQLQDRAPVVQDAILSHIQALPPAQFAEPNQLTLKDGLTAAIIAKVPDFPPDAVLIPEMDASAATEEPAKAK